MKYTVQVNEVKNSDGNIKAFASVVFDECFKITNIAILENKEKGELFVAMPSHKTKKVDANNKPIYQDVCHPITKEFREVLYSEILNKYEQLKNKKMDGVTEESA